MSGIPPRKPNHTDAVFCRWGRRIGISLGDPFGIGPEVVAKALARSSIQACAQFTLIGDRSVFQRYSSRIPKNCTFLDLKCIGKNDLRIGKATPLGAKASLNYLNKTIELIKSKEIDALVTAPLCKETIHRINPRFVGHTEYLAAAFKVRSFGMMFVSERLRTIIVTRHIPLSKVPSAITKERILDTIELTHRALRTNFKIKRPRIAVCGLNPHAGEGGMLGDEEIKVIIPALKQAQRRGIKVSGPFAADTLFSHETGRSYDAVVAMYHDQGLIPVKTVSFSKLINLTIGLPFIRTSPAHGTAFDIAGKKMANEQSMCEAIKLAAQLSS